MDVYRKNRRMMKKTITIAMAAAVCVLLGMFTSCRKDEVDAYDPKDCAVNFKARNNAFSLKGMKEDTRDLFIPVNLVGPSVDYDREISLEIEDMEGVQGRDFRLKSACIKAGELTGYIVLNVNRLQEGQSSLDCKISIVPNEYFRAGIPAYQQSIITWTELYSRPSQEVWKAWFLFFCKGYSQNLHKVIVEALGEETEHYTNSTPKEEGQIRKMPTWWYSASRALYEYVKKHDQENPDSPLMHSEDYEYYSGYTIPVGEGKKPEKLPTILETLLIY